MKTKTGNSTKGRLNAIDLLILLLLVLVLFVLVYLMFFADMSLFGVSGGSSSDLTVTYTLEISPVDDRLLIEGETLPINVGDAFYNLNSKYTLGTVLSIGEKSVYRKPIGSNVEGNGESLVYAEYPGKSSFTVVVQATAQLIDGVYYVEGKALRIGESFEFTTPYFTGNCRCQLVEEV